MERHYLRWSDRDIIEKFMKKGEKQFFDSEKRLLSLIKNDIRTVLDIGCASGRYLELLKSCSINCDYTGVDIIDKNIEIAREQYPESKFILGNALSAKIHGKFDLVNATGVIQHEPKFRYLIPMMISWSAKYIIFDVKIAKIAGYISDLEVAYAECNEKKLYFVVMSLEWLKQFLCEMQGIEEIIIFGYKTSINDNVSLPKHVKEIVSAGVLLKKGSGIIKNISIECPAID